MKKLYLILFVLILFPNLLAQSPASFNYQAVARNNSGEPLSAQSIGVNIKILNGSDTGITIYEEAHTVVTNDFGLFSLNIGSGTALLSSFELIDWSNQNKFLQIAIDPSGGVSYQVIGTVQLLSVPYALYAEQSGGDDDADPFNELQTINLIGSELSISNGNTVNIGGAFIEEDGDPANELQTLNLSGTTLNISNGNSVDISSINTDEQALSLIGSSLSISDGNSVDLSPLIINEDGDPTNEIQDLTLSTNILTITKNGIATPIDLTPYLDNTNLTESEVESYITNSAINLSSGSSMNGNILNDWNSLSNVPISLADGDQDNQILSLSGTTLALSKGGGTVSLSPFVSPWTVNGSNIYRTSGNIGVGTTSPITALHIYANRDVLGGSSMSGNGSKLIWDYSHRAFRAGYAAASSWNEDSIGLYSAAFGFGTVAKAYMSFAHGFYTHAKTYGGFSIGRYNVGAEGNSTAWTTTDPLFEVGNGTSNTNRNNAFTIRKDGRVGINDATPDYLFDIENPELSLRSIYINHDITSSSSTMYGIYVNADNTASNSGVSYAGYFDMTNNNDDAYGIYSLAFCDAMDASPAYAVRSYVDNDNGSGWAYSIYGSVSGTTTGSKYAGYFNGHVYTTGSYLPSDQKLKTNIRVNSERSIAKLMHLEVVNFNYLKSSFQGMNLPNGQQTGLLAQNVEEHYPELVKTTVQPAPTEEEIDQGAIPSEDIFFKAVDYTKLIPHLLKAIQEQQAEIETLKQRINHLESKTQ